MRLEHEDQNHRFQHAIYFDPETELYYELIRIRGESQVNTYVGDTMVPYDSYQMGNGGTVILKRTVNGYDGRMFMIRRGEHWKTIKARLPSYLMLRTL